MRNSASDTLWSLRVCEFVLAAFVLVSTWLHVDSVLGAYPTWLYVAGLTIPTAIIPATALAGVVLAELVGIEQSGDGIHREVGAIAAVTVLSAAYAVVTLNVTTPGVFFAGAFPLVTGVLLAVIVLMYQVFHAVRSVTAVTA